MMHAYGKCEQCHCEGALWKWSVLRKRFWLFGPMVVRTSLLCDECVVQ